MKSTAFALLAGSGLVAATRQCSTASGVGIEEGGNWFCGKVNQILYEGFVTKGSFKATSSMNADGSCSKEDVAWDGPLGPFGGELSIHVRGPVNFKEFAVYTIDGAKEKRDHAPSPHVQARRSGHKHLHQRRKEEWVYATIDGQVQSWINNWHGGAPTKAPEASAPAPTAQSQSGNSNDANTPEKVPEKKPEVKAILKDDHETTPKGSWNRVSYYNAEQGVAKNLVFLGNYGGQGSGSWSAKWGNSLAYLGADGVSGSSTPQVLKDIKLLPSNKEFAIFSGEQCDGTCGYSLAKDVAYKGFGGNNKVFLFKFMMPFDGDRGFNGDMPAIWALNARIPRSQQYGDCSCWGTGCGEADIYEVLAKGDNKCKSTLHLAKGNDGGSSDYFERPTEKEIKVAAVFDERSGTFSIKQLADDFDFAGSLSNDVVHGWIKGFSDSPKLSSFFQLSSK